MVSRSVTEINNKSSYTGIYAALSSALFLGLTPIFGKQAILLGFSPISVVALRTILATFLMFIAVFFFYRKYLYIYPAGLLGCLLAGWTNGLGSLFYYSALGRIDAGMSQLLYSLYPLFLILWMSLDRQPPHRLTVLRIFLAIPAIYLITQIRNGHTDWIGVSEMLVAAALYALHLPINQRVLYDMPAPTVTLYTLFAMSTIVVPTFIFVQATQLVGSPLWDSSKILSVLPSNQWSDINAYRLVLSHLWPILCLALVTFLSRLTLFLGVKHLGGMQTALLGLSELLVTLTFAHLWLGENFSIQQWVGILLLIGSLTMVVLEKSPPKRSTPGGFLGWLQPSSVAPNTWQLHD
jgi:drug/metabolite transporter (DMT)-like permease